ncbi:zinc-binding metallopeptidase family protein [Kordiimonas aquimaris]|uniref:aminopeptidase 1 n=1 Tax=Kordiimonas aquimaris TaxID=707591 RepID=UPI0021D2B6E2|nr:aminopeptidase 1 [Kordiimonas aquimaris]
MKAKYTVSTLMLGLLLSTTAVHSQNAEETCNQGTCISSWTNASDREQKSATDLGEKYKSFLHTARTELLFVSAAVKAAKDAGYKEWRAGTKVNAGDRYYRINRDRALSLIIGGENPVSDGVRIVASHIDSPRLELKGRPLYGKEGFAVFQTNFHGGIKTYQWTNLPLALVGRVDKKDGTTVEISVGLNEDDPIFMIPDLSPHVSRDQYKRSARELVQYEELDPIVASGPHGSKGEYGASEWVLRHLKYRYGISAADLISAELSLVPAMRPRDMGFDKRLIAAYGQDDRLSAFTSLEAALEIKTPPQTVVVNFADNEETGNVNHTGASSSYLTDLIGELLYAEMGNDFRQPLLTRALAKSKALSIDVNPGINPLNPGAWEVGNAPRLSMGINFKLYGQGLDATSEFTAWTRAALDSKDIPWQTATYKVARAGGGTLGREMSRHNIDTIDFGAPVLSIHTPYAVSDKMDVLAMRNGIEAFMMFERK